MKKTIICILLISSCFRTTAQMALDEDDFKNISNGEFIESLDVMLKYLNWMDHILSWGNDDDGKKNSEERTLPSYQLDTLKNVHTFCNFLNANLSFQQSMDSEKSEFKILDDDFHTNYDGSLLNVSIDTLFFCDGTIETDENELHLKFNNKAATRKAIDKISVSFSSNYISDFDFIELNKAKKSAKYNNKTIKIEELDGNTLIVSYDNELDPFLIEGLNAKKEVLDNYQSMTSEQHPDKARKMYEQMKIDLQKIHAQTMADSLIEQEKFQAKYLPKINKFVEQYFKDSGVTFKEINYYGNVDGARLYFAKKENGLHGKRTIKNMNPNVFFVDYPEENGTVLYDKLGDTVFQSDMDYTQLNSYFYEAEKNYYYFDLAEKNMQQITPCHYMEVVNNDYVMMQPDENEDNNRYLLINNQNQREGEFHIIKYKDNIILAINEDTNKNLLIPDGGEEKWFDDGTRFYSQFANGYAVILKDQKFGFIDNQANIVIPIMYDYAEGFDTFDFYTPEDKLFIVQKNDLRGAVNEKNETVIPFVYNELKPFSYGVTLAKNTDDKWGLINTKNEIIVPFTSNGYSLSTNFGKRKYHLNEQNYDYLGNPVNNTE